MPAFGEYSAGAHSASVDLTKTATAIGLQNALVTAQMFLCMGSLSVQRIAVEDRRRVDAAVWAWR